MKVSAFAGFALLLAAVAARAQASSTMAIAQLEFVDSSGEAQDQEAAHKRRIDAFGQALRHDLEARGGFRFKEIRCGAGPCASSENPETIQEAAHASGVKYVFLGGVHKMSTLVQWGKFQIVDEDAGRIAFDRLVTFRGDTDEAFARAEAFMVQQILDPAKGLASAAAPPPIKLALFDFELEDVSGGAGIIPESADDRAQLHKATQAAAGLIEKSGRYVLVSGIDAAAEKGGKLHLCDGCEASLARGFGADQSLLGIVTRVTRTDYAVTFKLRDAASGKALAVEQTDLRIGANYSWDRGAAWLIRRKLLERPTPR